MRPNFLQNIYDYQSSLEDSFLTISPPQQDRQLLTNSLLQRGQIFITQSNGQADRNVVQTR